LGSRDAVKNGAPNGRVPVNRQRSPPKQVLSKDYDHDRTISYRQAIHDHYSSEIKQLGGSLTNNLSASSFSGDEYSLTIISDISRIRD
jgi:hypothetical protein